MKGGLGMGRKSLKLIIRVLLSTVGVSSAFAAEYSTTQTGTVGGAQSCTAGTYLERIITVEDNFTVSDLNLGFLATHNFRGDIELRLRSPVGTEVQLINSNTNNLFQDNYNVELDDQAGTLINTAPHNTNDGTTAPPYENLVRPNNITTAGTGLGSFTNEAAQGNWTLRMCDAFPQQDNGTFQNARLYFTSPQDADLSLDLSASDSTPTIGSTVTLTLEVINNGPNAANGSVVTAALPAGLSFVSASGAGTYDAANGLWSLPDLPSGSGASLDITASVNPTGSYAVNGEITTAPGLEFGVERLEFAHEVGQQQVDHVGLLGRFGGTDRLEVVRFPYHENDRAIAEGKTTGLIKVMIVKGRPVGASIAGAMAGELIAMWAMAIANKMKMSAVAATVLPYPTVSEINKRAAGAYFTPRLFESNTVKRVVGFVQRWLP